MVSYCKFAIAGMAVTDASYKWQDLLLYLYRKRRLQNVGRSMICFMCVHHPVQIRNSSNQCQIRFHFSIDQQHANRVVVIGLVQGLSPHFDIFK